MKKIWKIRNPNFLFAFVIFTFILMYAAFILWKEQGLMIQDYIIKSTERYWIPTFYYSKEIKSHPTLPEKILELSIHSNPVLEDMDEKTRQTNYLEDEETIAKIIENQANEENVVDENGNVMINTSEICEPEQTEEIQNVYKDEELQNFDFLLSHFYLVDSTTTIDESQLNYQDLMSRSMKIDVTTAEPKVLVYHTHSQEAFVDSVPGDPSTSIVGIGSYLTELLNQKGIPTIHDEGVYDVIDGQLDRSMAYDYSKESVTNILSQNPSIEVVIDLHRDGVSDDTHLVTEVNGKQVARIMLFNGLSRTTEGVIEYLYNPYIQDNLSFSFQTQLASEKMYPGWARKIYLRAYRYNLEIMPKALLIEAGAQTNSVQEMRNAMELLSNTLYSVLVG